MDYYKLLQLHREPFSNSPDPDYFFQSHQHLSCMQKLELALRLKRGLNVVIGDVGTGKTTLCRQLIRKFAHDDTIEPHLVLDPTFASTQEFLTHIHELICSSPAPTTASQIELKEKIKQSLFSKGVDREKTVILIIDEGQKITDACVEILRELLNFETNTFKLLQIVIFAQLEFEKILQEHANFKDRINVFHHLAPMDFKDTRQMVYHRLKLSSTGPKPKKLFTLPAMWAIYRGSRGYPRKIIHICHQSMLAMIIQNRSKAGWPLVQSCRKRITPGKPPLRRFLLIGSAAVLAAMAVVGYAPKLLNHEVPSNNPNAFKIYQQPPLNQLVADIPMTAVEKSPAAADFAEIPAVDAGMTDHAPVVSQRPEQPEASSYQDTANTDEAIATVKSNPPSAETEMPEVPLSPPPVSLGKLLVKPGDTLMGMVNRVYGSYHNRYLRAVIEANTQIADPNRIDIGNIIDFPPLPAQYNPGNRHAHWVVLEEQQTLPSAMQRAHEITKSMRIPLQLMTAWSPDAGLQFQLLVKGYFKEVDEASNYIQALPEEMASRGYVTSGWPEETILYADPYGSGIH